MRITRFRTAVLSCIAFSTVAVIWSSLNEHLGVRKSNRGTEKPSGFNLDKELGVAQQSVFFESKTSVSIPVVRSRDESHVREAKKSEVPDQVDAPTDPNSVMDRELVTADKRAAMATTWGLTKQQTEAFENATEAPSEERLEVMMRFARGEIADADLETELEAADQRGLQKVHEVLGDERFNEYMSIRWHFEADEPILTPPT
jgi:hypothetical protein